MAHAHSSDDGLFVALSVGFALVGSFSALVSAARIQRVHGGSRIRWTLASGVSLGGGAIWAGHFIGMLGHQVDGRPVGYDLPMTALSLLIAVVVSTAGLSFVGLKPSSPFRLGIAGVLAGLGVAAMHYTGMAAVRIGSTITYDRILVITSVVIAVVAAIAALWIAFHVQTLTYLGIASVAMAGAICGLHYTAMAATQVGAGPESVDASENGADPTFIVPTVIAMVLVFVIFTVFSGVTGPESVPHTDDAAARPGRRAFMPGSQNSARAARRRAKRSPAPREPQAIGTVDAWVHSGGKPRLSTYRAERANRMKKD